MPVPAHPKIYHIVHVDRLPHIIAAGYLYSDAYMQTRQGTGTTIGMSGIKARRLTLELSSHPGLHVGDCVPFYFCPRSVMLYLFYQNNHPDLTYRGGQGSIVHLEADLYATIAWANAHQKRWAFTSSNAGAYYFEDYCATDDLDVVADCKTKLNSQGKKKSTEIFPSDGRIFSRQNAYPKEKTLWTGRRIPKTFRNASVVST